MGIFEPSFPIEAAGKNSLSVKYSVGCCLLFLAVLFYLCLSPLSHILRFVMSCRLGWGINYHHSPWTIHWLRSLRILKLCAHKWTFLKFVPKDLFVDFSVLCWHKQFRHFKQSEVELTKSNWTILKRTITHLQVMQNSDYPKNSKCHLKTAFFSFNNSANNPTITIGDGLFLCNSSCILEKDHFHFCKQFQRSGEA